MSIAPTNPTRTDEDLSALISSRICHDLINPMGAISNGLELLEQLGKNLGPELELVSDSLANATSRLNYFRIAFGQADAGAELRAGVLEKIVSDMFATRRFTPQVQTTSHAMPRQGARTMLLILLCVESAMPLGGVLKVSEVPGMGWRVDASGRRVRIEEHLWQSLLERAPAMDVSPGEVHFAAAAAAMRDYGLTLSYDATEDALSLTLHEMALEPAPA